VFLYERVGLPGVVHIDRLIKGRRVGQTLATGRYKLA
jgi:hypothetical protein